VRGSTTMIVALPEKPAVVAVNVAVPPTQLVDLTM
jgi:hypothetical protein